MRERAKSGSGASAICDRCGMPEYLGSHGDGYCAPTAAPDPVEHLRRALEDGDLDAARTLIGGVWHEREGLRRSLREQGEKYMQTFVGMWEAEQARQRDLRESWAIERGDA